MTQYKLRKICSLLIIILLFSASYSSLSFAQTPQVQAEYDKTIRDTDGHSYYAIIIGIEEYLNDIQSKRTTVDETAIEFYQKLKSGKNWHEHNIKLLTNEEATKNNIKNAIIDWLDPLEGKDDFILFYFIGKTQKTNSLNPLEAHTLSYCYDSQNSTDHSDKITDKELDNWMDNLESKHIGIILDTSFASSMNALNQRGRTILKSTNKLFPQTNPTDPTLDHTVFSHYLLKGLSGYADEDDDGELTLQELFFYSKTQSFHHSIELMINSIKKLDFSFHLQIPSLTNRHVGFFSLFTLPFGWRQLTDNGFGKHSNYATRGMTIFKDELYIGTQNNLLPQLSKTEEQTLPLATAALIPDFYELFGDLTTLPSRIAMHLMTFVSQGCEIWKYNYTTDSLSKVIGKRSVTGITAGFGSHFNAAAAIMKEFNGYLYVGTWNTPLGSMRYPDRRGCELWRTSDGVNWEQVVGHKSPFVSGGFGNPDNTGAWSIETFNDYLYVGTMNWDFSDTGGCEVWRSHDGLHWEQVVNHGFRPFMNNTDAEKEAINTYAWTMEVYNDQLYMGTFNSRVWLRDEQGTGGQLWRTSDGVNWKKMLLPNGMNDGYQDGFGEGENYGIRRMVIYNDELYCGIASSFFHSHGCEIWKYNGTRWEPVVSDEIQGVKKDDPSYDGFGNPMNKYVWSMVVTKDNKLWIGTGNGQVYLPFLFKGEKEHDYFTTHTEGCEIWCFDGETWQPVIKNEVGLKPNGLGDSSNLGARSMIEYPENSGNLVVGTFKLFNPIPGQARDGCELWMRYTL